ncbi:PAS domain S-box protein [Mycolicibacterium sp.]|uniref:PAS domain S-box protein n=1 Tax=Mycolicibacterium sp. TaxID=2320850 RepID=UPI0025DF5459|nr:PAS domain S-box protein [Mycolicibacterium sp.]MCB9408854.1 PAS domain S-box protein [Mycolicibacterium sp.]
MIGSIVVVDDEPGTLRLLKTLLETDGYEVRAFTGGAAALRSIGVKAPDLVMLDIRMPGLSGFDVCGMLKADSGSAEIPVIFLSAATDIDDKLQAFASGGVDYIVKPFEKAEVLSRARTHIALAHSRRENARYKQLIDTSNVATAMSRVDGTLSEVSKAAVELSGFDMDTALQMSWMQFISEPDLGTLLGVVEDLLTHRTDSYRGEHTLIHADGNPRRIDMSISCIREPDGQPEYLVFQAVDITAEAQLREHLAESRRLLEASADSMLDPQVLFDAVRDHEGQVVDLHYRAVNRAACQYLQTEQADLLGSSVLDKTPGLKTSGLWARYLRCLEDGEPVILSDFSYDNEILHDTRRYDIRATRAGPNLLSLTWTDVTDRYHAAARLAASEERYRLLAENSADIVCHLRDGRPVWVSPSIESALGAPPQFWLGQELFAYAPPEDLAEQTTLMAKLNGGEAVNHRVRVKGVDGVTHWFDLRAQPYYDANGNQDGAIAALRLVDAEVAAERQIEKARRQQARADALYRRSVDSSAVGMCLVDAEGGFVDVNGALCEFFGYDAQTLKSKTWQELTAEEYLQADLDKVAAVLAGEIDSYRMVKQYIHADGHLIWGDLSVSCVRDDTGRFEVFISQITDITAEVQGRELLEQARREKERDDERFRRSVDNAAVGMCLVTPEGRVTQINNALCRLLGLPPDVAIGTHWRDVTEPEYLEEEQSNVDGLLEGRIDSYRMLKRYQLADGRVIWGDTTVSAIRDDDGKLDYMITLIADVTARVEADERNRLLARKLQQQTDRLKTELNSAADYMSSLTPTFLSGPVTVSARYLPSEELGGDCLDFYWIDDDHLLVRLIDVSGHGLEPALLAVSVHNLMRSGTLGPEILLSPAAVLTELNRLFEMKQQKDHYFTMWFGIYERSTRTLRYASAGAPPALAFSSTTGTAVTSTELATPAAPIGMFEDTEFTSGTYQVPHGCRILVHSDGASEIVLADGRQLTLAAFRELADRVAESQDWSLDDLIDELRAATPSGEFEDDCSLILLKFD